MQKGLPRFPVNHFRHVIFRFIHIVSEKVLVLKLAAHSENEKSIWSRFSGKGLYPPKLAWMLLLPFRNLYLSPKRLAERLQIQPDWEILELGCGPAYFSPHIARLLQKGRLHLVDVQEEMIRKARKRIQKFGLENVSLEVTNGTSLNFPDKKFDCIYLITVLGEIQNLESMLGEISRVMKQNGLLSITEQGGDPDALTLDEVRGIIERFGFNFEQVFGKGKTFTANFRKKALA